MVGAPEGRGRGFAHSAGVGGAGTQSAPLTAVLAESLDPSQPTQGNPCRPLHSAFQLHARQGHTLGAERKSPLLKVVPSR